MAKKQISLIDEPYAYGFMFEKSGASVATPHRFTLEHIKVFAQRHKVARTITWHLKIAGKTYGPHHAHFWGGERFGELKSAVFNLSLALPLDIPAGELAVEFKPKKLVKMVLMGVLHPERKKP